MLPEGNNIFSAEFSDAVQPSESFRLDLEKEYIFERVDGLEAVRQAVFKALNTERYRYPIYSWDYGIELDDLFGKPYDYVAAELVRRITEALECDDRIRSVGEFQFSRRGSEVLVRFKVCSIFGTIESYLDYKFGVN